MFKKHTRVFWNANNGSDGISRILLTFWIMLSSGAVLVFDDLYDVAVALSSLTDKNGSPK